MRRRQATHGRGCCADPDRSQSRDEGTDANEPEQRHRRQLGRGQDRDPQSEARKATNDTGPGAAHLAVTSIFWTA